MMKLWSFPFYKNYNRAMQMSQLIRMWWAKGSERKNQMQEELKSNRNRKRLYVSKRKFDSTESSRDGGLMMTSELVAVPGPRAARDRSAPLHV
jgi:hypothetical protein